MKKRIKKERNLKKIKNKEDTIKNTAESKERERKNIKLQREKIKNTAAREDRSNTSNVKRG